MTSELLCGAFSIFRSARAFASTVILSARLVRLACRRSSSAARSLAAAARHSNPTTGGESQLRFVSEAGLGEAAEAFWAVACLNSALEAFWAVACLNSALLARATAERGAVLAW
jgi:hypothetical protein